MNKGRLHVINVLSKEQYDDAHIKGSIGVPLNQLLDYVKNIDKEDDIILYCASYICGASGQGWHALHGLGFKNVYAYEGGLAEWYDAGYPVEGPAQMGYFKVNPKAIWADKTIQRITKEELKAKMEEAGLL